MSNKLRFRASGAANLMTNKQGGVITEKQLETLNGLLSKLDIKGSLTDKQALDMNTLLAKRDAPFELSDTAKSWVDKIWRKREKDVEEFLSNKYIEKGLSEEESGISLLSDVDGNLYKKYVGEKFDNGVFNGTPDILFEDYVDDVKSSWSLETFMNAQMTDLYYGQLQVYMELTGKRKARLRYCLVDTPDKLIEDEKRRVQWKLGIQDPDAEEHRPIFQRIETNMTFSDDRFTQEERVKTFEIEYDEKYIKELYNRCEAGISYYKSIKLGGHSFYKKAS